MDSWTLYAQILWTGLATSSYHVLFATAFALELKVAKVWNFTQAGVMTVAFYAMFWALNSPGLPVLVSVMFGLAATVALSLALEGYGFRVLRERKSPPLTFFIFTLVFSEFIAYAMTLLFGTEPQTLFQRITSPVTMVASIAVSQWDLLAIAATVVPVGGLFVLLRWTRQGQFLVAVSDNGELAELYGISTRHAFTLSLVLAAVLSTAGMYLYGTRTGVHPNTTLELMIFAVIATILGGIGNVFGAAIAAVVLALLQGFSVLVIESRWQGLLLYLFLFLTILFMPQGFRLPRRRSNAPGRSEARAADAGVGSKLAESEGGSPMKVG